MKENEITRYNNGVAVDSVTYCNKTDKRFQDFTYSTNLRDVTCSTNTDEMFQVGACSIKTD